MRSELLLTLWVAIAAASAMPMGGGLLHEGGEATGVQNIADDGAVDAELEARLEALAEAEVARVAQLMRQHPQLIQLTQGAAGADAGELQISNLEEPKQQKRTDDRGLLMPPAPAPVPLSSPGCIAGLRKAPLPPFSVAIATIIKVQSQCVGVCVCACSRTCVRWCVTAWASDCLFV